MNFHLLRFKNPACSKAHLKKKTKNGCVADSLTEETQYTIRSLQSYLSATKLFRKH